MPTGVNRTKLIGQSLRVRRLQPRAAGRGHVLRGDQPRAGAHAGAGVRRGQVAIRLGDRRRDGGVRSDDGEFRDARPRAHAARSRGTRPPPERMRRPSLPVFVVNMSTDGINFRRQNFSFFTINNSSFATVDPSFRGLTINGAPDPRVAVTNAGKERHRARHGDLHARQVSGAHDTDAHRTLRRGAADRRRSKGGGGRSRGRGRGDQRGARDAHRPAGVRRRPARPPPSSRRRSSKSVGASCSSRVIASAICVGTTWHSPRRPGRRTRAAANVWHADLLPAA